MLGPEEAKNLGIVNGIAKDSSTALEMAIDYAKDVAENGIQPTSIKFISCRAFGHPSGQKSH
jgi:enoyl-CoA hydratase/carnithine racemase